MASRIIAVIIAIMTAVGTAIAWVKKRLSCVIGGSTEGSNGYSSSRYVRSGYNPCPWDSFMGLPMYRESGGEGQAVGIQVTARPLVDTYNPYDTFWWHTERRYGIFGFCTEDWPRLFMSLIKSSCAQWLYKHTKAHRKARRNMFSGTWDTFSWSSVEYNLTVS